jgi:hypothetical protein
MSDAGEGREKGAAATTFVWMTNGDNSRWKTFCEVEPTRKIIAIWKG